MGKLAKGVGWLGAVARSCGLGLTVPDIVVVVDFFLLCKLLVGRLPADEIPSQVAATALIANKAGYLSVGGLVSLLAKIALNVSGFVAFNLEIAGWAWTLQCSLSPHYINKPPGVSWW